MRLIGSGLALCLVALSCVAAGAVEPGATPPPSAAQTPAPEGFQELQVEVSRLQREGNLRAAEPIARRAVGIAEAAWGGDSENTLDALETLAGVLGGLGRIDEELALRRRVVDIRERARPGDRIAIANAYGSLAMALRATGRLDEAEKAGLEAIRIFERQRSEGIDAATTMTNHGILLTEMGRLEEAETYLHKGLGLKRQLLPQGDPALAEGLGNLASLRQAQNRLDEAEALARQALEMSRAALPPDHPDVAVQANNLAQVLRDLGRVDEALELQRQGLEILERNHAGDHADLAVALSNLAGLNARLGRFDEAERLYRNALEMLGRLLPQDHPSIATAASNLGVLLGDMHRLDEAEALHRRALAILEVTGPATEVSYSLNNLGSILSGSGRLAEAEELYRRSIAILETDLPEDHPNLANPLNNLAHLLTRQGRLGEGEQLYRRALSIRERSLPENDPSVAETLTNLGTLLNAANRPLEAEKLYRRALAIDRAVLPADHPDTAHVLVNLGAVLLNTNRAGEAEPVFREALAILEKRYPKNHPSIATTLNNLATSLDAARADESVALLRRALAMREAALPADHPEIANALTNLASTLASSGHPEEAGTHYLRAIGVFERGLPENHPDLAGTLVDFARLPAGDGRFEYALGLLDRATRMMSAPENREISSGHLWEVQVGLRNDIADEVLKQRGDAGTALARAARRAGFIDLQWSRAASASRAITTAIARAQDGESELATSARERDRLAGALGEVDAAFLALSASTSTERAARTARLDELGERGARLRGDLAAVDATISERFPKYAQLAAGSPVSAEEVQSILAPDEVLITITPYGAGGFVYAYGRDAGVYANLPEPRGEFYSLPLLASYVRCSVAGPLDPGCRDFDAGTTADDGSQTDTRGAEPLRPASARRPLVRLDIAEYLYVRLFPKSVETFIAGKKLIIVPPPELMGLPWQLLLTAPPPTGWDSPDMQSRDVYKSAAWMFQSHPSISVMPSVSALYALRTLAPRDPSRRAYLGFGDPVIGRTEAEREEGPVNCDPGEALLLPSNGTAPGRAAAEASSAMFAASDTGTAQAMVEVVRMQPRLRDTRCELLAIAETIAAPDLEADLYFSADATETRLKAINASGDLAGYSILHFATHGLLAGDLGLGEPALILTPPAIGTEGDDGVLTASEVSDLDLAADWVILSACNTASGADGNSEALSGLARSFFYAGARSLLVSSWPVYSPAAVEITTRSFAALERDPSIGRAGALAVAMKETLANAHSDATAHPSYWAPFLFVGEPGTR